MFDRKAWNKQYAEKHREQIRSNERARGVIRRSDPEYSDYQADKVLKCRYGISLEQKRLMYEEQKGLCKLCGKPLPEDFRKAHVDHAHETDEIRGLLHWPCNRLVGFFERNQSLLGSIYTYLGWTKGEN
jgi:recombination endonuclease VII